MSAIPSSFALDILKTSNFKPQNPKPLTKQTSNYKFILSPRTEVDLHYEANSYPIFYGAIPRF